MPAHKRSIFSALLIIVILSGLFLVLTVHFIGAQTSGTDVSGIINKDTTWTQANSPYTLTGPVAVNTSVTLTIEAGAVVYFGDGNYIEVNGTLVAIGTDANNIQFSNGTITFSPVSTGWNELSDSGSTIQHADFVACQVNVQSPAKIDHDTFNGGKPNYVIDASCGVISNNTMTNFYYSGIYCSGNASVLDNTIIGGTTGGISISSGSPLIQGNLVINNLGTDSSQNVGGIFIGSTAATPVIENNALTDNVIGILIGLQGGAGTVEPNIIDNNIYNNPQYNFELNGIGYNVSATNNWWGATNTQAINKTIYDFKDNSNLGNVSFVPFLDSPNTQAPTFVNATAGVDGSISPSGIVSLNYGGSQNFNITPNTGYHIANVIVNGTSVGAVSSYTVQNVSGATTISAIFAANQTPTPSPTPTPGPPASPSPAPTPTPQPSPSPTPSPLRQPTLSVSCVSSTSYTSFNVEINGELVFDGAGISGAPILLSYSVTGGTSWQSLTLVDTSSDGNFSAEWLPSVTGNFLINATYAGNSAYSSVSTIVNLVVIPFASQNAQDVFSVASNSTVSDLAFNSTSNELTFTVSGPSGSTGYVDVYIAKSLIGDISTLQVYLDGNQISYTATSQGSSWVIYFTFGLSTHQVTVYLASKSVSKVSEFPSLLLILTVFIAVSLCTAVLVKVKRQKRCSSELVSSSLTSNDENVTSAFTAVTREYIETGT